MGAALDSCSNAMDASCLDDKSPLGFDRLPQKSLRMRLRVDASPIRQNMGTYMHNFMLTDEFEVDAIEVLSQFEPMSWRHEHAARSGFSSWPSGPRTGVPMRYVRARIAGQWVIMAVPVASEDRTMERCLADLEDSKDVATYAHSFNAHLQKMAGGGGLDDSMGAEPQVPTVRVCAPVGCRVLHSASPQLAQSGAVVTLIPYPSLEVRKFVFDGSDDFDEVPQAFFHFAVWMSGGRESLYDLQGTEIDDGEFLVVDPVLVRAPKISAVDAARTMVGGGGDGAALDPTSGPNEKTFDALHPRCGQLCKGFDPMRRGMKVKHMCGLDVPGCGLR